MSSWCAFRWSRHPPSRTFARRCVFIFLYHETSQTNASLVVGAGDNASLSEDTVLVGGHADRLARRGVDHREAVEGEAEADHPGGWREAGQRAEGGQVCGVLGPHPGKMSTSPNVVMFSNSSFAFPTAWPEECLRRGHPGRPRATTAQTKEQMHNFLNVSPSACCVLCCACILLISSQKVKMMKITTTLA